ncbi:energy transducer TonB [Hymenobacter sp. IS2118]|uniref:energy transducer TonB n=1 Tax=Hymenobacter sp. IS2118 TaxID=1505605 RepID=UPI00068E7BF8|nr:energy transducer TonB [Hymenobacter sp. IS2118]
MRRVLPGDVGAHYRRETEYTDSVAATVKTYSVATGKLTSQQGFANLRKGVPNGVSEWWYPAGQLHIHEEYALGRRVGELRTYYPSGQLKRREVYNLKDDFNSTGECFAESGQSVPFYKFEQMPVYSVGDGGSQAIVAAVQRGIKYPWAALKAGCTGKVVVSFNVTALGEVADIRIVQSVCPAVDEAVLSAVRKLKSFKPGLQDGQPVAVAFSVPVTFAIN